MPPSLWPRSRSIFPTFLIHLRTCIYWYQKGEGDWDPSKQIVRVDRGVPTSGSSAFNINDGCTINIADILPLLANPLQFNSNGNKQIGFGNSNGGGNHGKKKLKDALSNPCKSCGGVGHWAKDPKCPNFKSNKNKNIKYNKRANMGEGSVETHIKRIPQKQQGEAHTKVVNGHQTRYWCAKCSWNGSHLTTNHVNGYKKGAGAGAGARVNTGAANIVEDDQHRAANLMFDFVNNPGIFNVTTTYWRQWDEKKPHWCDQHPCWCFVWLSLHLSWLYSCFCFQVFWRILHLKIGFHSPASSVDLWHFQEPCVCSLVAY